MWTKTTEEALDRVRAHVAGLRQNGFFDLADALECVLSQLPAAPPVYRRIRYDQETNSWVEAGPLFPAERQMTSRDAGPVVHTAVSWGGGWKVACGCPQPEKCSFADPEVTCPDCLKLAAAKEDKPRTVAVNAPESWQGFPPMVWEEERGRLNVPPAFAGEVLKHVQATNAGTFPVRGPDAEPLPEIPDEPPPGCVRCAATRADPYREHRCTLRDGHEGAHEYEG